MNEVRRLTSPAVGFVRYVAITYSPYGKVVDRAEVGVVLLDVGERREHHEAEDRERQDRAHRRAEPDQRRFEELRARESGERLVGRRCGRGSGLVGDRTRLGLDLGNVAAHVACDVTRPQQAADDREHRADGGDDPAEDEAEEEARDPDREPDRPQARPGDVRGVVTGFAQLGPARDSIARTQRMSTT